MEYRTHAERSAACTFVAVFLAASVNALAADPSIPDPPQLTSPLGGTIAGAVEVSPSGAATYSIPIPVPPGTAGLVPKMSLDYHSQSAGDLMGRGWSIGGLSAITRCGKTIAIDDVRRGVKLTVDDEFCLDGKRLVRTSGTHHGTATYRTKIDELLAAGSTAGTDIDNGPVSWKVRTKNGNVLYFGTTTDSRVEAAGKTVILHWAVSRVEDRSGNYIDFSYGENATTGEHRLNRIRYTGNTSSSLVPYNAVNFIYEARPDKWSGWVAGTPRVTTQRLAAVQTRINTATDGTGGTLVRDLRMDYGTYTPNGRSLVTKIEDCDAVGVCLPETTFNYTTRSSAGNTFAAAGSGNWGVAPVTFSTDLDKYGIRQDQLASSVLVADVDGDGRSDLISSTGADSTAGRWRVCRSTGTSFSCSLWSAGPYVRSPVHSREAILGDYNGDGRTDFVVPPSATNGDEGTYTRCDSTGSAWDCSTFKRPAFGFDNVNKYTSGDFDGDGRDDFLIIGTQYISQGPSWLCKSTGATFDACMSYAGTFGPYGRMPNEFELLFRKWFMTGDFNGDGRTDIGKYRDGNVDLDRMGGWGLYFAGDTGYTTGTNINATSSGRFLGGINPGYTRVADSNGDPQEGYDDLHATIDDPAYKFETCYSTGLGLSCQSLTPSASETDLSVALNVADYDSDGRPDALSVVNGNYQPIQLENDADRRATSSNWTASRCATTSLRVFGGDFNGDGIPDAACYDEASTSWTISLTGHGGFPNLLASVNNGLGHTTRIAYLGMFDADVYTAGSPTAWPKRTLTKGPPVVSLLSIGNAKGGSFDTEYRYAALRSDLQGWGLLGFEKVTSIDKVNGITTLSTYSQDWPITGLMKSKTATQTNGTVLSSTSQVLSHIVTQASADTRHPYVRSSTVAIKDLNGSALSTATSKIESTCSGVNTTNTDCIDLYGNVTSRTETVVADGETFTTQTISAFSNDTTNWIHGRPSKVTVTKKATGATDVVRTVGYTYVPGTFLVDTETIEPDDPSPYRLKLATQTTRHPDYGVPTKITLKWRDPVSATDKTRDIQSFTTYDTRYRWPTTIVNAEGHPEIGTYDGGNGQVLTRRDPNNLTTTWAYDGWGREKQELRPDGSATATSYHQCQTVDSINLCNNGGVLVTVTRELFKQASGALIQIGNPVEEYFDPLGRAVRTLTRNMGGSWVVRDRTFDDKGRLDSATRAHLWSERNDPSKTAATNLTSDAIGRFTRIESPQADGAGVDVTTIEYLGLDLKRTNAKLQARTERRNGLGLIKSATDAAAKQTSYLYDPFGNLRRTTDPAGNQINVIYDKLGRKTQLKDPDLGTWNYLVDPLGRTYQQTDAKSQITKYTYDDLGRLTQRLEPDQDSRWAYDTAAYGKGLLAESYTWIAGSSSKDYRRIHSYDTLSRPNKVTTKLDWDYVSATTYDPYARGPATLTHSRYNKDTTTGQTIVLTLDYNARGVMNAIRLGTFDL
jgi:YD repeat-containing protein